MILDASVAAKWFLKGERYEIESLRLRRDFEDGNIDLHAPSLILYEVCNSLWKRQDIQREELGKLAEAASSYLGNLTISHGTHEFRKVVLNARAWGITVYDSSYATMAHEMKTPLITADQDLTTRLSKVAVPNISLANYKPL